MPVSPQDFALWSDLTGNPYPRTPSEQMALAPEVYSFTRNLGRRGGPTMSPLRRAVDVVGKTALGLGALAGAAYLGKEYLTGQAGEEKGAETFTPRIPPTGESQAYAAPEPPPMPTPGGATTEQKIVALGQARAYPRQTPDIDESVYDPDFLEGYTQHQWQSHRRNVSERAQELINRVGTGFTKLEVDNEVPVLPPTVATAEADPLSQAARVSQDITPPTTAQRYGQPVISGQTSVTQEAKGLSPVKPTRTPIEAKPVTQSEVISGQQSFSPGSEIEMVGEDAARKAAAFRKSAAYATMQKQYPGLQDIESPTQPASSAPVVIKDVNVGEALRSKGLTLGGGGGDVYVTTPSGRDLQIFHPYAEHSKPGIRQTALAEQNEARELLASAGVTPEAAKSYWSEKIAGGAESPIAAMSKPAVAPVTAKVEQTSGPTASEIRDMDALLLRSMGNLTQEQRASVRDKLLSDKYKSTPQVEPQSQVMTEFKKQGFDVSPEVAGAVVGKYLLSQLPSQSAATSSAPAPTSTAAPGPSPESVRFARETARGMSRVGLMAQREAGRASLAQRAEFGSASMEAPGEEPRELADPRVMREMMRRPAPSAIPSYF